MTILQEYASTLNSQPSVNPDTLSTYDFPAAMLARLQKEQGWTTTFTLFAVEEYRRFVQLAATAPHAVTPSQTIDEVWHTHLMFTRDYWERFTPLLPAPLHHEPGDGTPGSDAHFAAQYARTLELYRAVFGQEPPPEVWPDPSRQPAGKAEVKRTRKWPFPVAFMLGVGVFLLMHSVFLSVFIFVLALILLNTLNGNAGRGGSGADGGTGGVFFSMFDTGNDSGGDSDSGGGDGGDGGSSCGGGCGGGCGS